MPKRKVQIEIPTFVDTDAENLVLDQPDVMSLRNPWIAKGSRINVLDHGFVKLVDFMGSDDAIVQAARVSHGAGTKTKRTDEGLIRYLVKNRHTTPLEMVVLKFHVRLPIFVARQWIRHRMGSFNEISARYSILPADFYIPESSAVLGQDTTGNRQGRAGQLALGTSEQFRTDLRSHSVAGYAQYMRHLDAGVARELARCFLPLNIYTEWYWKVDLHNLMGFLSLRTDSHAQWEIQQYANTILELASPVAPAAFDAWETNRRSWAKYAEWLSEQAA